MTSEMENEEFRIENAPNSQFVIRPSSCFDGVQLLPLSLLLPPCRASVVLRRPQAGETPDPDDSELHLLRLGKPAVLVPAPVLDAHRLHRRPCRRAGRAELMVVYHSQTRSPWLQEQTATRCADRLDLGESHTAGVFQVLQLRRRELQRGCRLAGSAGHRTRCDAAGGAAPRHQPVRSAVPELRDRHLSRPYTRDQELQRFSLFRDDVSPARGGSDHSLFGD